LCLLTDFISVELDRGQPRLLIDFGSGTLELKVKTKKSLDDGEWHKIDVFWDTEVRISLTYELMCASSRVHIINYIEQMITPPSRFFRFFQNIRLVVDNCRSADITELEDGSHPEFDDASCQAQGTIPPFNEYLNINSPLQIGGRYVQDFDPTHYHWQSAPYGKGFDGCIKNVYHNSKVMSRCSQ